jgi:hypothetical protein
MCGQTKFKGFQSGIVAGLRADFEAGYFHGKSRFDAKPKIKLYKNSPFIFWYL